MVMTEERKKQVEVLLKTEEETGYWHGITNLGPDLGLFRVPNIHLFKDMMTMEAANKEPRWRYFLHGAYHGFQDSLRDGTAKLGRAYAKREDLDIFLKEFIAKMPLLPLQCPSSERCSAILDFTRTSLPQLSGKQMRDAFAMGFYLSHLEEVCDRLFLRCHDFDLNHKPMSYGGREWRKPEDCGELFYEELRRQHPVVIYWNITGSISGTIIHPDYQPPSVWR
jgi:hypothetical protein